MWTQDFETGRNKRSHDQGEGDPDFHGLLAVGLAVALAAFFASMLPAPLFTAVMSELLRLGALGAALAAVLRQDRLSADAITAWDQAAILLFLGLLCGLFVDAEAVSEVLGQMSVGPGKAPA